MATGVERRSVCAVEETQREVLATLYCSLTIAQAIVGIVVPICAVAIISTDIHRTRRPWWGHRGSQHEEGGEHVRVKEACLCGNAELHARRAPFVR